MRGRFICKERDGERVANGGMENKTNEKVRIEGSDVNEREIYLPPINRAS